MIKLTSAEKHDLQSSLNSEIHRMKLKISELFKHHPDKFESGSKKIRERIARLHKLKHTLDCYEGYSQQPKKQKVHNDII